MISPAIPTLNAALLQALAGGPLLARELESLAPLLEANGHGSLAKSVDETIPLVNRGILTDGDWQGSSLHRRLERLVDGHDGGELTPAQTSPSLPADVRPFPRIAWEAFGDAKHPPPHDHGPLTMAAGLSYASSYIAGIATGQMTGMAFQSFYGVSDSIYRQVRDGGFFPEHWGHFNSNAATRLITGSGRLCAEYGQLLGALLVGGIFEAQGWSLGTPEKEAAWDLHLLYGLRVFAAREVLTEAGKQRVLDDRRLQRVVRGEVSLKDRRWHPGHLRRDIFNPWLAGMAMGDPNATQRYQRELGDALLRSSPSSSHTNADTEASRLHGRMWDWFCHEWYGHLPVEDGTFAGFETFLMDTNPASIPPGLQERFEEACVR